MTIIIGLTGGIATGKTTISNFLKKKKYSVHDSDAIVKKMYASPSAGFIKHLKNNGFLSSIKGTKINKKLIRDAIFNNKQKKRKLEDYIHNEVRRSRNEFLKKHKQKKTKVVILDIPLLFEAKLEHVCDYIILLYLPKKTKILRALNRKGMKKDILLKILKNQKRDSYKKKKASYVINTSKTKKHSFKMILKAIGNIINSNA
tara:strand:- start:7989 stop:8594 length:606 start_codon:yes stop_codon:yes gene_type:complete